MSAWSYEHFVSDSDNFVSENVMICLRTTWPEPCSPLLLSFLVVLLNFRLFLGFFQLGCCLLKRTISYLSCDGFETCSSPLQRADGSMQILLHWGILVHIATYNLLWSAITVEGFWAPPAPLLRQQVQGRWVARAFLQWAWTVGLDSVLVHTPGPGLTRSDPPHHPRMFFCQSCNPVS